MSSPSRRLSRLPKFVSPRSRAVTEERQARLEVRGYVEWGTPATFNEGTDQQYSRSADLSAIPANSNAKSNALEDPPELDIGEPLFSSPSRKPLATTDNVGMATNPAGGMSPSSSPRLPSPPPFPEVQIGPKSPTGMASTTGSEHELEGVSKPDVGATRRIRPGTKAADMASGPPLVPLNEVKSCYVPFFMLCTRRINVLRSARLAFPTSGTP